MYSSNNVRLGEILKSFRVQNKLTQEFVATQLNLSRSSYTYYEIGKTEPNLKSLGILAKMYNVDLEVFLMDKETFSFHESGKSNKNFIPTSNTNMLTQEERELIALFRISTPTERRKALAQLNRKNTSHDSSEDSKND